MIPIDPDALPQERQQRILDQLRTQGRVVANELALAFAVSEDSIRRDLREMAAKGLCRRVYGGALLPTPQFDALPERLGRDDPERNALAAHAASLLLPGQVVLMDAGSTNVAIARALRGTALTVVTNAPAVADALSGAQAAEVVMIGGRIDPRSGGAIGSIALQQLAELQADVCIPGVCAVDPETGIWGINAEECAFKQAMLRASDATLIVASNEKLGARGSFRIAGVEQVDQLLISDRVGTEMQERLAPFAQRLHRVVVAQA
ncbi:DeoR/GlpR family DNA-binding transcription regulator [Stenotrophomonas sp.]|uniref:DeoR/GlpR family DNA-binding transcription regulator n=1 Tax=Stenotrophomonas sp. TaxID=69392 RepID=UPI0028A64A28|nr:DeoR/GlpR family DNA-binding transcription regulator [Stenotrophomonas sp.]